CRCVQRRPGARRASKYCLLLPVVQVPLHPERIGVRRSVCVISAVSVRILVHHLSRACEGRRRRDLWSSHLLLRTDNGLLAPAKWITTLRSCARSSERVSTGGCCLTMSSSRWRWQRRER